MSKHKLRKDKTCLNCGAFVEGKYCFKCGQENKESRESFSHLILEFIFDLVHFDSSFWKTTQSLLFSPAKLSKEYMSGKRKSYVNPIKLYIFISFFAFLVPALLPYPDISLDQKFVNNDYGQIVSIRQLDSIHLSKPEDERIGKKEYKKIRKSLQRSEKESNNSPIIQKNIESDLADNENKAKDNIEKFTDILASTFYSIDSIDVATYGKIISSTHFESVHYAKAPHERLSFIDYMKYKIIFNVKENSIDKHKQEKMKDFAIHSLPKTLFVYMPIFAFWMWLFNLNRKKYYFDSGIFTLHFFSFWLLLITLFITLSCICEWLNVSDLITRFVVFSMIIYILFYFFRGNRIFYEEKRWLANLKSILLIIINIVFILFIFVSFVLLAIGRSYS